jgi:hypothetical protein
MSLRMLNRRCINFCGRRLGAEAGVQPKLGHRIDLGSNGPGIVLKSRFEWDWGSRPNP